MGIIYLMLVVSLVIALFFLLSFFWATKTGQFDDEYGPSVRILFEDEVINQEKEENNQKQSENGNREV